MFLIFLFAIAFLGLSKRINRFLRNRMVMAVDENDKPNNDEKPVHYLAPKVAPIWVNKPDLWFYTVEAQFSNANVKTQIAKYNTVLGVLTADQASVVGDILENPGPVSPYDSLKKALIERLGASSEERVRNVLRVMDLGDKKPSQLLREMKNEARDAFPEGTLRILWIEKLPASVRATIVVSNESLDQIALLADKVYEVCKVSQLSVVDPPKPTEDSISRLEKMVSDLQLQVSALTSANARDTRFRSRSRSRPNTNSDLCYYHERFGNNARKCREGCSFFGNSASPVDEKTKNEMTSHK